MTWISYFPFHTIEIYVDKFSTCKTKAYMYIHVVRTIVYTVYLLIIVSL